MLDQISIHFLILCSSPKQAINPFSRYVCCGKHKLHGDESIFCLIGLPKCLTVVLVNGPEEDR